MPKDNGKQNLEEFCTKKYDYKLVYADNKLICLYTMIEESKYSIDIIKTF